MGEDVKILYVGGRINQKKHNFSFWLDWFLKQIKVSVKNLVVKFTGNRIQRCYVHIPKCKYRRKYSPFVDKNTIVVYPEIVFGNPFKAKKIVRWLLFHNRQYSQKDGQTVGYDKDDLFFAYREIFNDRKLNPSCRILNISYYDLDLYKRTNYGERSGKCYILRKGAWRSDLPAEFDGPIIDDLSEKEKVEILNKCEYCISYDTQTGYSMIAALCGCISVVVPEKGKTWRDYRTKEEYESFKAIAFGFEEEQIKRAVTHIDEAKDYFINENQKNLQEVKRFIKACEEYFDNIG